LGILFSSASELNPDQCAGVRLLYFPLASLLKTRFLSDAKNAVWLDIMYVAGMATGVFQAMGFWMMASSFAIQGSKWFKTSGAVIGLLLIASILEHFGRPSAPIFASLNVIANVFWSIWMVIFAIQLLDFGKVGNRLAISPAYS
jgi:hypothetical protein